MKFKVNWSTQPW